MDRRGRKDEVKKNLTSLLVSSSCTTDLGKTMSVHQLLHDYKTFIGEELPIKEFGYETVDSFLQSFCEALRLTYIHQNLHVSAISMESLKHIERLIANQKPRKRTASRGRNKRASMSFAPVNWKMLELAKIPIFEPIETVEDPSSATSQHAKSLTLKENITKVLKTHASGVTSVQFLESYNSICGEKFPTASELGYSSVIECLASIPDVVRIERERNSDWHLYPVQSSDIKENCFLKNSPRPDIKEVIRQVVYSYPGKLPLKDFDSYYEECMGVHLDIPSHGYRTIEGMLQSFSDCIEIQQLENDLLVLSALGGPPEKNFLINSPLKCSSCWKPHRQIPNDIVGPSSRFTELPSPCHLKWVEVNIGHINNPSEFWVQLRGVKTTNALINVMDCLDDVYKGCNSEKYKIPVSMLTVGMPCAAKFHEDQEWYRATITGDIDIDWVQVFYVDYGGYSSVHKDNIRLLKHYMISLPAQAIKAELAMIQPVKTDTWPSRATASMFQMCKEKALVALVTCVSEDNVMSLCLCDTDTEPEVHINDALVNDGLARFVPENIDPIESLDNSPACQEMEQTNEGFTVQSESVQRVECPYGYEIHVIALDGFFLTSAEISKFFWNSDILQNHLRLRRMEIPDKIVRKANYPKLFDKLICDNVSGVLDHMSQLKPQVKLFSIECLPRIMEIFNHENKDFVEFINILVQNYSMAKIVSSEQLDKKTDTSFRTTGHNHCHGMTELKDPQRRLHHENMLLSSDSREDDTMEHLLRQTSRIKPKPVQKVQPLQIPDLTEQMSSLSVTPCESPNKEAFKPAMGTSQTNQTKHDSLKGTVHQSASALESRVGGKSSQLPLKPDVIVHRSLRGRGRGTFSFGLA